MSTIANRRDRFTEPGRRSRAWQNYEINKSQVIVIDGYTPGKPIISVHVAVQRSAMTN